MTEPIVSNPNHAGPRRVYVASPLNTFDSPDYDRRIDRIRELFPGDTIIPARGLFGSNGAWRRKWLAFLKTIDLLVFFADPGGFVGRGVWHECTTAHERGIPVRFLTEDGSLLGFTDTEDIFPVFFRGSWKRYVRIDHVMPKHIQDKIEVSDSGTFYGECGAPDDICAPDCCAKARFEADMRAFQNQRVTIVDVIFPDLLRRVWDAPDGER